VASIHVKAGNSRTLGENATLVDRNNICTDISAGLIKLLEPELDRNIRGHFVRYLM
jgi:hypothetical protein